MQMVKEEARTKHVFKNLLPVILLHSLSFILYNSSPKVEYFTKIGGNSVEDSVTRSLVRLLTNEVAVNFSYEGRKGKRALNKLTIIQILERVISASHTTFTKKIFENRLREWFRQAGTRIWNKTKKLQQNNN